MATTSNQTVSLSMTGDVEFQQDFPSSSNPTAPGMNEPINLTSGNNTITVPSGSVSVLIKPPSGNAVVLLLKGVNGDTGISIHPTNPTLIALAATVTTFVINAASSVTGLRLIFS